MPSKTPPPRPPAFGRGPSDPGPGRPHDKGIDLLFVAAASSLAGIFVTLVAIKYGPAISQCMAG